MTPLIAFLAGMAFASAGQKRSVARDRTLLRALALFGPVHADLPPGLGELDPSEGARLIKMRILLQDPGSRKAVAPMLESLWGRQELSSVLSVARQAGFVAQDSPQLVIEGAIGLPTGFETTMAIACSSCGCAGYPFPTEVDLSTGQISFSREDTCPSCGVDAVVVFRSSRPLASGCLSSVAIALSRDIADRLGWGCDPTGPRLPTGWSFAVGRPFVVGRRDSLRHPRRGVSSTLPRSPSYSLATQYPCTLAEMLHGVNPSVRETTGQGQDLKDSLELGISYPVHADVPVREGHFYFDERIIGGEVRSELVPMPVAIRDADDTVVWAVL